MVDYDGNGYLDLIIGAPHAGMDQLNYYGMVIKIYGSKDAEGKYRYNQ